MPDNTEFVRNPFVTRWSVDFPFLSIESDNGQGPGYLLPIMGIAGIKHFPKVMNGRYQSVVAVFIDGMGWIEAYKSRANFSTALSASDNAKNAAAQLAQDLWNEGPASEYTTVTAVLDETVPVTDTVKDRSESSIPDKDTASEKIEDNPAGKRARSAKSTTKKAEPAAETPEEEALKG